MSLDQHKLTVTEKLGYGLGDCAANFVFQTQIVFLLGFYTDVFGIGARTVAYMFLVSRLWDAVNDPLIGILADRTNSRWGKFRPWVLFTAVPFAICFVLAFTTPDLSDKGKIVWAYVTYNLLMMVYTANNIPYSSLSGVITPDRVERTSVMSWRFFMALIAGLVVQSFTLPLVDLLGAGDPARGYQLTIGLWALISTLFFVVAFLTTKERVQPSPTQAPSLSRDLGALLSNRSWIVLAIATFFYFTYLSLRGSVGYHYFTYVLERQDLFSWFNGLGVAASLAGILLSKGLAVRFGKLAVFQASLLLTMLCTIAFYWAPVDSPYVVIAMQCLLQFVYGVGIPLLWAMMADVADLSELTTGRRATAITFAATVFALKIGLSVGGALAAGLLEYYGYVANQPQSPGVLQGMILMMSLLPAVFFACSIVSLFFYRINRTTEISMGSQLLELRRTRDSAAASAG